MTREQIIEYIESRYRMTCDDVKTACFDKKSAMIDGNLERANRCWNREMNAYMLQLELETILNVIKE